VNLLQILKQSLNLKSQKSKLSLRSKMKKLLSKREKTSRSLMSKILETFQVQRFLKRRKSSFRDVIGRESLRLSLILSSIVEEDFKPTSIKFQLTFVLLSMYHNNLMEMEPSKSLRQLRL